MYYGGRTKMIITSLGVVCGLEAGAEMTLSRL